MRPAKVVPLRPFEAAPEPSSLATYLEATGAPVGEVLAVVSIRFGFTYEEIRGKDRHKRIAHARNVAAWMMRQLGLSYPEIGAELGGRHHTTAIEAVRRIDKISSGDPRVANLLATMITPLLHRHTTDKNTACSHPEYEACPVGAPGAVAATRVHDPRPTHEGASQVIQYMTRGEVPAQGGTYEQEGQ
jgi:hypothetical protein